MKKSFLKFLNKLNHLIGLIFVSLAITAGLGAGHAQELGELNTGSVVRLLNCSIDGDFTLSDATATKAQLGGLN